MSASAILLPIILLAIGAITIYILCYFGDRKTFPWYAQVTSLVGYFFPFTIIIILPLDLASVYSINQTRYKSCLERNLECHEPLLHVNEQFLYGYWQVVYWITFNMQMYYRITRFIVPIMNGYIRSGAFSFKARLKQGIMDNVWFYTMVGVPSVFFLIYALVGLRIPVTMLLDLAIPASNAYGLVLLSILMGFGLVEIPRGLWYNSSTEWKLRMIEAELPSLKESCVDTEAEVYEVARLLALASQKIPENDPIRPKLNKVLEKSPLALNDRDAAVEEAQNMEFNEQSLATLHSRIVRAHFLNKRQQAKLRMAQEKAFLYQDILANMSNPDKLFDSAFCTIKNEQYKIQFQKLSWWWFCRIQPITMKALSVLCAICSVLVIWSESTFQITSVHISIPSLILSPGLSTFVMEILALGFLCYMCTCTFSTLLRIKILDFYQMVPNHNTDEVSLLWVGSYLCKLTFPLCYNFLNMGGVADGKVVNNGIDFSSSPVFIQYFGPAVNLTPLLGQGYNDWVAFLVLIVCTLFILNLHSRLLRLCGLNNYFYEPVKMTDRNVEDGMRILEQARTMELRRLQREDRQPRSVGRARNTAELLARYQAQGVPTDRNIRQTEVVEEVQPEPRTTRAFGVSFGKKQGYQRLGS